jgi:hypothetical protein
MNCSSNTVEIIRGSDHVVRAELRNREGTPFDLTGATAIEAGFSKSDGTNATVTLVDGDIEIASPEELGTLVITLPAAFTDDLRVGPRQSFEVKVTKDSKVYKVRFPEMLDVIASKT